MKLKIMTFNIRCINNGDGINIFENRKPKVLRAIREELPDIIGFQEVTDCQREFLRKNLLDRYTVIGCGRNANYYGEAVCIAFRHDLFELVSFETFWLSDTPTVAGSMYENIDQSIYPRFTVHAKLASKELDSPLHFFNTHLDHSGEKARLCGIREIIDKISVTKGNFVLTGDFNAIPSSDVIAEIKNQTLFECFEATENISHTFHGFGKFDSDYKIDYIFSNGSSEAAHIVDSHADDGIFISDHHPLCATVKF